MTTSATPAPLQPHIARHILSLRDQRVMLDAELAALYGVETKVLVQAIKRNNERFPADFMFQLSTPEWESLRSQFVTSNMGRGGRRYAPYSISKSFMSRREAADSAVARQGETTTTGMI